MAKYAKFFSVGGGAGPNGLQLPLGTVLDATLRQVQDGTGTGSPLYLSTGSVRIGTTAASAMYWDNVNNKLGIGTNIPSAPLEIRGANFANVLRIGGANTGRDFLFNPYYATSTYGGFFSNESGNITLGASLGTDNGSGIGIILGAPAGTRTALLQVKGTGSTSATTSLLVQNSAGTTALEVLDDLSVRSDNSQLFFKNTSVQHRLGLMTFTNNSISCLSTLNIGGNTATTFTNTNLNFQTSTTFNAMASPNNATRTGISIIGDFTNAGAGINSVGNNFNITTALNTSVGNVTLNQFNITNAINTTGGTTLQRGFYYNPTLTGTVGFTHRAIETVTGDVLLGTTSGRVGIGISSPAATLDARSAAASDGVDKYTGFTARIQNTKDGDSVNAVLLLVNQNGGNGGYYIRALNNQAGQERFYVNGNGGLYSISSGTFAGNVQATQIRWNTDGDGWIGDGGLDGTFMVVTNGIERYRVNPSGNLLLGTTTDLARLTVRGSGSTSATTSLLVQNSNGTESLKVTDDRSVTISGGTTTISSGNTFINGISTTTGGFGTTGYGIAIDAGIRFGIEAANSYRFGHWASFNDAINWNNVSASVIQVGMGATSPNVNNITWTSVNITPTFNSNFAGRSGNIVRGIYYNPTITSFINGVSNQLRAFESSVGGVFINTTSVQTSAILQADSTTQGFLPPRMTSAQKIAISTPTTGLIVFDTDLVRPCFYNGATWITL